MTEALGALLFPLRHLLKVCRGHSKDVLEVGVCEVLLPLRRVHILWSTCQATT